MNGWDSRHGRACGCDEGPKCDRADRRFRRHSQPFPPSKSDCSTRGSWSQWRRIRSSGLAAIEMASNPDRDRLPAKIALPVLPVERSLEQVFLIVADDRTVTLTHPSRIVLPKSMVHMVRGLCANTPGLIWPAVFTASLLSDAVSIPCRRRFPPLIRDQIFFCSLLVNQSKLPLQSPIRGMGSKEGMWT